MKNQLALLSIEIAEKIIKQELSGKDKQKDFIQRLIDEVNVN
jgi:F-type H+-transporting ATPase subunit b